MGKCNRSSCQYWNKKHDLPKFETNAHFNFHGCAGLIMIRFHVGCELEPKGVVRIHAQYIFLLMCYQVCYVTR